jgi:hypothetical protein
VGRTVVGDQIQIGRGRGRIGRPIVFAGIEHQRVVAGSAVEGGRIGEEIGDGHRVIAVIAINREVFGSCVADCGRSDLNLRAADGEGVTGRSTDDNNLVPIGPLHAAIEGDAAAGNRVAVSRIDDQGVIAAHAAEDVAGDDVMGQRAGPWAIVRFSKNWMAPLPIGSMRRM